MRLLFASSVIVSHSYPLTQTPEIFSEITNGQLSLGGLAVDIFFIMSGYLILTSLKFSKTPQNYLWKRVLRLFPALAFVLLLTLIWTPILYSGSNILEEKTFWTYLPNNLSLYNLQYNINHVMETNPYPGAINGSLWSLCYEFTMYMFILLLFPLRKKKILPFIVVAAFIVSFYCMFFRPNFLSNFYYALQLVPKQLYKLSTFFIAGSVLTFFDLKKINTPITKATLAMLLILSIVFNVYQYASYFILPVLTILVGLSYSSILNYIPHKIGDISYGMYIYGFPVQQSFMHFFDFSPHLLTICSLPVAAVFSYISWNLIEKRAMKLKNLVR